MKTRFISLLRDPIWQLVGVLVSVIGIFVAITQTKIAPKELLVVHQYQNQLADRLFPGNKFKLAITDIKYDLERSTVDYYLVINRSGKAIRSTDFVAPLTVTASHKTYRIASVDSCAKEHAQVCGVNSAVGADPGTFVATSWKQIGQSWLAENPLLNSDDVACVAVISEHEDLTSMAAGIKPSWTARVADVTLKIYHSRKDYSATRTSELAQFFYTSILLQGTDVYWFLLLFTFMLAITLRMAGLSKLADLSSNKGITIVVVSIIMAASSSEILVYIFASDSSALAISRIHPISWPLLVAHIVLVAILVKAALVQRRRRIEA